MVVGLSSSTDFCVVSDVMRSDVDCILTFRVCLIEGGQYLINGGYHSSLWLSLSDLLISTFS